MHCPQDAFRRLLWFCKWTAKFPQALLTTWSVCMCETKGAVAVLRIWYLYFQQFLFCFYITLHFLPWEPFVTSQQPKEILLCNNYGQVEHLPSTCLVRLAPQRRVPGHMVSIWCAAVPAFCPVSSGIKTPGALSLSAWWAQLRKTVRLHDGF